MFRDADAGFNGSDTYLKMIMNLVHDFERTRRNRCVLIAMQVLAITGRNVEKNAAIRLVSSLGK